MEMKGERDGEIVGLRDEGTEGEKGRGRECETNG
jgi:hypothetical protein